MAVNFSQYSKKLVDGKIVGKTPEPPWTPPKYVGPGVTAAGSKSSFSDEVAALTKQFDKTYKSIMANPNLSAKEKEGKIKTLKWMRDQQGIDPSPLNVFKPANILENAMGTVGNAYMKYVGEPFDMISRINMAAITELSLGAQTIADELLGRDDERARENEAALDKFLEQKPYTNPDYNIFGSYSPYNIEDTDFKGQGKWIGPTARFTALVAADPSSYVTLGPATSSRAVRAAMSVDYSTVKMIEKYPMLAGRQNLIARFGAAAIPENVRWAEGIESGAKFMGMRIQGSDGIANLWMDTGGAARAAIGDALYATQAGKNLLSFTAPKSLKPLIENGLGRYNTATPTEKFIRGLGIFSSDKWRRATSTKVDKKLQAEIGQAFAIAHKAKVDMELVTRIGENPMLRGSAPNKETLDLVDAIKNGYAGAGDGFRQEMRLLAEDYDLSISEMGFIDDFVYHTLSKEGRKYRFGKGSSEGGMFNKKDITSRDMIEGEGTVMYRKYRAAKLDDAGNPIDPEMFFNEPVILGTIEEMNGIFDRYMVSEGGKPGQKWFETRADVVYKGYTKSIGEAHGRIAFVRRMFDFGDYSVNGLLYNTEVNQQLVDATILNNSRLKSIVNQLRRKATRSAASATTKVQAGEGLEEVSSVAVALLDGQRMIGDAASAENMAAIKAVDELMAGLEEARAALVTATADSREWTAPILVNQLNEARMLREALLRGEGERLGALKILRSEYMTLHPNASAYDVDGASAEWLAEAIVRRYSGGKGSSRLMKKQQDIIDGLRKDLENATGAEASSLDEAILMAEADLKFAESISNRRQQTSYAGDGVLFMHTDEYGVVSAATKPISSSPEYMDNMRIVPAVVEDRLLDPRDAAGHYLVLREPSLISEALDTAFVTVGLDNKMFREVVSGALENGEVDRLFAEVYPEESKLIQTIIDGRDYFESVANENVVRGAENLVDVPMNDIVGFYGELRNDFIAIARRIDSSSPDDVGHTMFVGFVGGLAEGDGAFHSLVPMSVMHPELPDNVTSGNWSIALGADVKIAENNVGVTASSKLGDNIINGTLESHEMELYASKLAAQDGPAVKISQTLDAGKVAAKETILVDGVETPVKNALKRLTGLDKDITVGLNVVDAQIAKAIEDRFGVEALKMGQIDAESRMIMSFDHAAVIKKWDDNVGEALTNEIANMKTLLETMPAKGSQGALNRAWTKEVTNSLKAVADMDAGPAKDAAERVLLLVYADEARLAAATADYQDGQALLGRVLDGEDGQRIVKSVKDGWTELKSLGVEVPDEVFRVWLPNIENMLARGRAGPWFKGFNSITDLWKRYVTATPGFFVRNGLSATFLNGADGIGMDDMIMGARWAGAQVDTKQRTLAGKNYNNWMERAGVTDMDMADYAMDSVAAAGRGVSADNGIPGLRSDRNIIADNPMLRAFSRKNDFVENMVRLPVAIDSYKRGFTLDQSIARIERLHLNYGDLSELDMGMKKIVPFWIWTSRNIPLQMAQMATRPKAYYEYERLREEFPNEMEYTPKWIEDRMPLGIGSNLLTPDLPHVRLAQVASSLVTPYGIAGQTTPWMKVPIEVLFAKRQLGIDVGPFKEKQNASGYQKPLAWIFALAEQTGLATYDKQSNLLIDPRINHFIETFVPPLAVVNRLTGGWTGGKDTLEERIVSSWANYFGVPLRQVKEEQQRSEAMRRKWDAIDLEDLIKDLSELRENKP